MRRRRRLDHRRARRGRGQEGVHAIDVLARRPRRVSPAALCVRSGRPGEPGQGDADATAVRRGPRPVSRASARARRRGGAVLAMAEALLPTTIGEASRALAGLTTNGSAVRIRAGATKLGWGNQLAREYVEL